MFHRRDELIRQSDKYRNEQGKLEAEIKDNEVKINDLDQRKAQVEKNFYNVDSHKRSLQRQIKVVEDLQRNMVGTYTCLTRKFSPECDARWCTLLRQSTAPQLCLCFLRPLGNLKLLFYSTEFFVFANGIQETKSSIKKLC